ncbi:MAG: hypothetical protein HY731_12945 [Candidatus Tectomicrobia bacterium]|nr:hypothetical protein [Candidatus Tectomicrobia bacterium]
MCQPVAKPFISLIVAVFMVLTPSLAGAESPYATKDAPAEPTVATQEVSAGAMIADAFLVRPVGLGAMILGTVAFIISLPFSLPTRSADKAAQKLIVEPAKYTFTRPLGQL